MMSIFRLAIDKIVRPYSDLAHAPRAMWYVIGAFALDSMAYFGLLTLMTTYLSQDLHWGDKYAAITVSLFTMSVTLAMLGIGSVAESFGLRRAILAALAIAVVGRSIYSLAPCAPAAWSTMAMVLFGLALAAFSGGILQPVCYSGVRQFTDEKTSSMGYAMIYAFMNLGIVVVGEVSAYVRPAVQGIIDAHGHSGPSDGFLSWLAHVAGSGVQAVNWICCGISVLGLVLMFFLLTRRAEATRLRPETTDKSPDAPSIPWTTRMKNYFTDGPFGNARFLFFVFMLLPVQTLFAHQWLTMPQYILRAYPQEVSDHMEQLVNWINPGIIFFGVPLFTALTRRVNVYTMMVIGTLVSALPTFLLCIGPHFSLLIVYLVVFSIGEALWSARFLEYAAELAPAGRVAQYMGLAQVPWLLAKGTTGLYSGFLLAAYCPDKTPASQLQTGTLWLIYGCIAISTPMGLWLARRWVMKGLHTTGSNTSKADAADNVSSSVPLAVDAPAEN
jgi:proton-dependent oligopeptide transporter, POT family